MSRFFLDRLKELVAYFGLYESSLDFQRGEDLMNTVYEKLFILQYVDS